MCVSASIKCILALHTLLKNVIICFSASIKFILALTTIILFLRQVTIVFSYHCFDFTFQSTTSSSSVTTEQDRIISFRNMLESFAVNKYGMTVASLSPEHFKDVCQQLSDTIKFSRAYQAPPKQADKARWALQRYSPIIQLACCPPRVWSCLKDIFDKYDKLDVAMSSKGQKDGGEDDHVIGAKRRGAPKDLIGPATTGKITEGLIPYVHFL